MKVPSQLQHRRWDILGGAVALVILVSGTGAFAQSGPIEPNAGTWKTWVISSGEDFRVPPPPDAAAAAAELAQMRDLMALNDPAAADAITFWDAGSPAYRWIDLLNRRLLADQPIPYSHRIYTYLTMAMYDATIATWELKYFYNRPRPGETDPTLAAALPTPRVPPIRPNMLQPPEPPRRSSPTSFRTRRRRSRRWPRRRHSRGSSPASSSRATPPPAWSWGDGWRSR